MKTYFVKTPSFIQKIFSNLIWSFFYAAEKTLYLTFDDGPTPEITEWTLKILKEYNAKATFFCIGKNADNHPEIFNQLLVDGHSVGNHTHNHLNGWKTSTHDYIENVNKAEKSIQSSVSVYRKNSKTQILNSESDNYQNQTRNLKPQTTNNKLFRPPYGKIRPSQVKKLRQKGYQIIMWDVLSADFDLTISKEKCLGNVIKNTKNGSVIIFHDSVKASEKLKYVLPKVLERFTKEGYQFKRIVLPN